MNRLRGAEESEMRRMLVILKHSSALPAQLLGEEGILCHSWLPVWWRKSKGGVCKRAQMHSDSLKLCQVRIQGVWFSALIQAQAGREGLWDCSSPDSSAGWILLLTTFLPRRNCLFGVPVGLLWTQNWAQTCICAEKLLIGSVVIGQREMVLHWKEVDLDQRQGRRFFFSEGSETLTWAPNAPALEIFRARGSEQLDQAEDISAHCRGAGLHRLEGSLHSLCWCS